MTYYEAVHRAQKILDEHGVPDASSDAMLLLQSAMGVSRADYYAKMREELPDAGAYFTLVEQRAQRVPLQQITGCQYFMGLPFTVTPDVLVPRMDTETLANEALIRLKGGEKILDLCTGSGCLLLSLMKLGDSLNGTGSDISQAALDIARENAGKLGVKGARFILSDLFEHVDGIFDMIVSNPPYIPSGQIDSLMDEVKDHEPHMALDGGPDGLYFYRKIIPESAGRLKAGGWLLTEIGYDQAGEVTSMFDDAGYEDIKTVQDLAGNDRVVLGRKGIV